jgi:hypothetical protein
MTDKKYWNGVKNISEKILTKLNIAIVEPLSFSNKMIL